jgi:PiT family inorganic phosphate transporter
MNVMLFFILLVALWLAYVNGANDNFKGVATLFGSGTTDYRRALWWATGATLLGSLTAIVLGTQLIKTFSGTGLVPDMAVADPVFRSAIGLGAAGTVLLATRLGWPISTTHSLLGALIGAGLATYGPSGINLNGLATLFLIPLLLSPLLALGLAGLLYPLLHRLRLTWGVTRETCLCIGEEIQVVAVEPQQDGAHRSSAAIAVAEGIPSITIGTDQECFERYVGSRAGIHVQTAVDKLHYLSAGAVSFARGLNDTPKIVALLVTAQAFHLQLSMGLVGIAIAAGGLISARRVAETMSHRVTGMNHGQGLTANLVTAVLVIGASKLGIPVSTTHVSCGSLFGIGVVNNQAQWKMIGAIVLAWIITLPVAALLAACTAALLSL